MFHQCWPLWWPFPGSAHCWEPEGVCELFNIQLSVCLFVVNTWTDIVHLQFKISLLDQIKHLLPRLEDLEVGVAVERAMLHLRVTVTVAIYNLHEESRILRMLYFPPKNDQTSHPGQLRALSNDFEKPIPCDLGALADEMNSKTEDGWIMMMGGYGSYNLNFKTCMSSSLSFEQVAMSSTDSSPTLPEPFRLSSNSFGQCLICT